MRYAVIADIHANLPALEAVLGDVAQRRLGGACVHLGDLVGYAPWPNEVIERLARDEIPGVSGNYDSTIAARADHCGCRADSPEEEERSHESFSWTLEHVTEKNRARLARLPFRLDLSPRGAHAGGPRLIAVHGTPTLNTLYWTEDRSDEFCRKMLATAGARAGDVVVCGHTHKPWVREIEGVVIANAGSVGRPKDGDRRACYAIVDFAEAAPTVELVRVAYGVDTAVDAILDSDLPDVFAEVLRQGDTQVEWG